MTPLLESTSFDRLIRRIGKLGHEL